MTVLHNLLKSKKINNIFNNKHWHTFPAKLAWLLTFSTTSANGGWIKNRFFFNSQINLTTLHLIADVLWFKWQDSVIHLSEALCLWKSEPKELMSFWCVIMTSEHGRNVWCCIWFLCEQEASLLLGKTQLDCLAIAGKVSDICKCACLAKLIDPATYTCMYAQADPNMSGLNMIAGCSMMLRTPTLPYLLILSDALHCLKSKDQLHAACLCFYCHTLLNVLAIPKVDELFIGRGKSGSEPQSCAEFHLGSHLGPCSKQSDKL